MSMSMVTKQCPMCGETHSLQLTDEEANIMVAREGLIQNILPSLGPVEREFLKTGYCISCQELLFGDFNKPNMDRWVC